MVRAYLSISTEGASSLDMTGLIESLRKTEGVLLADAVSGEFSVIAVVEASDVDTLRQMVSGLSERNPIIAHIETSIAVLPNPAVGG